MSSYALHRHIRTLGQDPVQTHINYQKNEALRGRKFDLPCKWKKKQKRVMNKQTVTVFFKNKRVNPVILLPAAR